MIFGINTTSDISKLLKISIFLTSLKVDFSCIKSILFYPEFIKQSFWAQFAQKTPKRKVTIFCPKPWTNPIGKCRLFRLFKILTFLHEKAFFSIQNIKKHTWEKWPFLTTVENFDILHFFKTWLFLSEKHSFLSRISKKRSFLAGFAQKPKMRKMAIFGQKPWTNPFGKFRFYWTFLKLHFCCPKSILFFPEYQKTMFPSWISPKTTNEKNGQFLQKSMD